MQGFGWARIAIYFAGDDTYAPYYREALEHAGLQAEPLQNASASELGRVDVLLLCGYGRIQDSQIGPVADWVARGGTVVASGSDWGLERVFGLDGETRHKSNDVLAGDENDRLWPDGAEAIRFFGGDLRPATSGEVIASCSDGTPAVTRRKYGDGCAWFIGPHIGQTMALMQLGRSVECDAIGPTDGSAVLDDGKLRAEDGSALDFNLDRKTIEGCEHPFFGTPHADALKEIWIRAILNACDFRGRNALQFWHWPRHTNSVAALTLDVEDFSVDKLQHTHRILTMFGCPAAWIVGMPGYPADVYRVIRAWEHEVGLLFVTDDGSGWHEEKLKIQYTAISRLSGMANLTSVRPLDGKWRGWTNFYDLSDSAGPRLSLSKGGRQPGTTGFLFGTSHLFFPVRRDGSSYHTAELPYSVYLPGKVTADPVADEILAQTVQRSGCFHILMRPEHITDTAVSASLRRLLSVCKQNRMEFMLPDRILRYEKAKRALRIFPKQVGDEGLLTLASDTPIDGLSVLVSGSPLKAQVKGKEVPTRTIERYGARFTAITLDVEAKQQLELKLTPRPQEMAA